jgi:hypothetical protein
LSLTDNFFGYRAKVKTIRVRVPNVETFDHKANFARLKKKDVRFTNFIIDKDNIHVYDPYLSAGVSGNSCEGNPVFFLYFEVLLFGSAFFKRGGKPFVASEHFIVFGPPQAEKISEI